MAFGLETIARIFIFSNYIGRGTSNLWMTKALDCGTGTPLLMALKAKAFSSTVLSNTTYV